MDQEICIGLIVLAGFLFLGALVWAVALARRGKRCPTCGRRLPPGSNFCPVCDAPRRSVASAVSAAPPVAQETPGPAPAPSPAELAAISGPLAGRRFPIPPQGLTIGRLADNDIVLAEELMVSRHHAIIVIEQGQYILYDRDSANGTWVNEQRIFRHVLTPGDRIQIWQSLFAFTAPGAAIPSTPAPSVPVSQSSVHVVGESFCGYQLESLIGQGGMSEVFKARDAQGRTVAIKILQETDPYLVAKFVQEGNQIGPLLRGHENIIYVYEFGQSEDQRLYLVMEYVDAPSLRKVIRRPWSEPEIVSIIGQVCDALAFAHEHKVVHRDIKPENILLTADGKVKVLDFGIAKLTSASTVTRDKIVGTPEYISPEQARGDPVRPASDVYSLGIVLYEMLTGSVPFSRPRDLDPYMAAMEVIRQHLHERPEPIRKRNPNIQVSNRLERVTMRALKKNLKSRYKTAREMGEALGYQPRSVGRPSVARPRPANLVIIQGPKQGQRFPLDARSWTLGRMMLGTADRTVSRRHAKIIFRGGGYWLQDISTNGTWVNDQRVYGEVPLQPGSLITIGDSILRLEFATI